MMTHLRKHDRLAPPGKPDQYWEVLDERLHACSIHVFDAVKHEARFVKEEAVRAAISDGRMILHRKGMPQVSVPAQYGDEQLHARVGFLCSILRRIEALQLELGLSFGAAIPRVREDYIKEKAADAIDSPYPIPFPSRTTLFEARKKQCLGLPILKGNKNKGNRTPRYAAALVQFVQTAIRDYYLVTQSRWTERDLTAYINREAHKRALLGDERSISRKFVLNAIGVLTADAEYDRMDPLLRIAGKSYAKKRIRAALPFARIEQDAVHLPFVVKTPHGIARTVYLVLAIDVCTGYPVGWHLTLGAPREMDSLSCLEMYLTAAKVKRFKEFGIEGVPNIYGTPLQIIFDNGPETKGGRIERLQQLGMDVKHCKAKEAQGKPFIERLNRSLKEALQTLPGCTRFEGKDGQRDPEALGDSLLNIEELEKWIVRWLYQDWVNTPLERLRWDELLVDAVKGKTPLERLKYLTEDLGQPITLPPPRQQWMAALFEHTECTLSAKTGITLEQMHYKGEAMAYLLGKYGDGTKLHVLYHPDDFRCVYVHEADALPLVVLTHEHVRPGTPAWTFTEAKEKLTGGMKDWVSPEGQRQFLQDLDEAATARSSKGRRKSPTRGKREADMQTVRRAKDFSAQTRALEPSPVPGAIRPQWGSPSLGMSQSGETHDTHDINYDDAPELPIVRRNTGENLL